MSGDRTRMSRMRILFHTVFLRRDAVYNAEYTAIVMSVHHCPDFISIAANGWIKTCSRPIQ